MSTSPLEVMQQADRAIEHEILPGWVGCFLRKTFFDKCPTHQEWLKNELNRYCITCSASLCRYCISCGRHDEHKVLTMYRHVYQDVVPLTEMESHIDCDKIQPYKCNKKWVVSLTPLPHNGSGSLIEGDGACNVCKRKLTDPQSFRFCSIACKVRAVLGKDSSATIQLPSDKRAVNVVIGQASGNKRSRKGVPHRAPFF